MQPFIGVSGYEYREHIADAIGYFYSVAGDVPRNLGIVVKVNDRTLSEDEASAKRRAHNPLDWNDPLKTFPPLCAIPDLFFADDRVYNFVHLSPGAVAIGEALRRAWVAGGPNIHGIIVNAEWPPAAAIEQFVMAHPQAHVILRVSRDAVRACANSPEAVAARLEDYEACAGVLVNSSGPADEGGKLFPVEEVLRQLRAIAAIVPKMHCCVAGGLSQSPHALAPLVPVLREFPNVSMLAGGAIVSVGGFMDGANAMIFIRRVLEHCVNAAR